MNAFRLTVLLLVCAAALMPVTAMAQDADPVVPAQAPPEDTKSEAKTQPTPEEKMARRWPQPARVGDLVGRTVVDDDDSTIGRVRHIVRTEDGKLHVVVSYGGLFGVGSRLVAVPVEAVALIGPFVAPLDFKRQQFETAPTWFGQRSTSLPDDETIRVGISRR